MCSHHVEKKVVRHVNEHHDAGDRHALRREQQRRRARQGMRVGKRPDLLHPVTFRRARKLLTGSSKTRQATRED